MPTCGLVNTSGMMSTFTSCCMSFDEQRYLVCDSLANPALTVVSHCDGRSAGKLKRQQGDHAAEANVDTVADLQGSSQVLDAAGARAISL